MWLKRCLATDFFLQNLLLANKALNNVIRFRDWPFGVELSSFINYIIIFWNTNRFYLSLTNWSMFDVDFLIFEFGVIYTKR